MKKLTLVIVTLVLFVGCAATGQNNKSLTKAEKAKWKTEAKQYKKNPLALKLLSESENQLAEETDSLLVLIGNLQNQISKEQKATLQVTKDVKTAKQETLQYKEQLAQSKNTLDKYSAFDLNCPEKMVSGTVFRVQVGAYRKRDMSSNFNKNVNFGGETEDGLQKYTIGQFRAKTDAVKFRNQLIEIGLVDAWVVTYQDGKRSLTTKAAN